ncbi:MAG: TIGR00296 family protein [Candidatus Aenigmatarchaeota archaeon]
MEPHEKEFLLKLARDTIELWAREGKRYVLKDCPDQYKEPRGVFVTIHTWPEQELRGCIGYPEPVFPLALGVINAAIQACSDPRFEYFRAEELDRSVIEVSVLSKPELMEVTDPEDYKKKINIGRDGLIVQRGVFKGLLLPQVASQHGLDIHEFLIECCLKAGLPPTAWMEPKTQVFKFQADVFGEKKPGVTGIKKS